MSNCIGVSNGSTSSATMIAWYQGNFIGVLNRLAGSEEMQGKRRGGERALDSASYKCK